MAASLLNVRHQNLRSKPVRCFTTSFSHPARLQFQNSSTKFSFSSSSCSYNSSLSSVSEPLVPKASRDGTAEGECGRKGNSLHNFWRWVDFIPGGNWWNMDDLDDDDCTVKAATPTTVWHVLSLMWSMLAKERWVIYIGFGSLTVAANKLHATLDVVRITSSARKLSEISIPNLLAASIFSAQNGESLALHKTLKLLIYLCFTSGICSGLRSGCFGIANMIILKHLKETLYMNLIFQDISFFDRESVGNLTSRLGADCQRLSHVIGNNLHLIVRNALQGVGALINLLTLSWPLALSACFICCLLSAIFLVYGRYQKKASKVIQDLAASANEVSQETLSLVRIVRVYGTESNEHGRYKQWLDKMAFTSVRESAAYGVWNLSFNTLYRMTQVFAILLGGMSILTGHTSAEQLTKYVLYCEWLIYAVWRVTDNCSSLLQSVGASEKVFQLMDASPTDQFSRKGLKLQSLEGQFEFINVSFRYPSRMMIQTLEQVNICVQANEAVAIVGPSGSGKSTLAYLLLGLYEPTHGQILIDGHPLKDLDIRWLREHIGYVGQEPHLFRMDIKSNIAYGCSRDIKQEDVESAARQAYAHEFISALPDGYETIVNDGLLSRGQKQRIAIARAILRDPAIMILDEPTSALDTESESFIQELMLRLKTDAKAKRSILFIAHRLSTARSADRIVVMNGGRVVEMGDHVKLLEHNGLYAQLHRIQTDSLD